MTPSTGPAPPAGTGPWGVAEHRLGAEHDDRRAALVPAADHRRLTPGLLGEAGRDLVALEAVAGVADGGLRGLRGLGG